MSVDTYWRLDWRVPAENAIGGKSYWTPFEDARHIATWSEAVEVYRKALRHHDAASVRLVRVEEHTEQV